MENSFLNQYLSFLETHNSMEDATEDIAGIHIYDAYVQRAGIIQRPPRPDEEVELFAGS